MGKRNRKYTVEEIKEIFSEYGCVLLSEEYPGMRKKMEFKCSCGKKRWITFRTFLYSKKCRECTKEKIGDIHRLGYEDVKNFYRQNDCELLSLTYDNVWEDLEFICSCGGIHKKSFFLFKQSPRCKICQGNIQSEKQRFSYEYVKSCFEKRNCQLLSKEYINNNILLDYVCSCGCKSSIAFGDFMTGTTCRKCFYKRNTGKNHYNWQPDRKKLKENKKYRVMIRNVLRCCLKIIGVKKNNKTEKMLGYTYKDLKTCIKNHPNYIKVKDDKWHIDHIFPIKAFLDYHIKDVKLINCLDNLEPIEAIKNLRKNCKYDKNKFEEWLRTKIS